jgi:predicted GNAT family N-acyltransferase
VVVEFFGIGDAPRMEEALAIRLRVFVEEQSVPLDLELDEHDRDDPRARHCLVRPAHGGEPLATGRYYDRGARAAQIGRLAVLAEARGRGVGAILLTALMAEARREGYIRATLDAQTQAEAFYLKAGFTPEGATFWDAGILHRRMSRPLDTP